MTDATTFTTFDALVAVMRARRIELGLSQLAVDDLAGLASGYVAKIEASLTNPSAKNARSIGRESLPLMLGALGLVLAAQRTTGKRLDNGSNANEIGESLRKRLSDSGKKAGIIRWSRMTTKQRVAHVVKMNRARAEKRKDQMNKRAALARRKA